MKSDQKSTAEIGDCISCDRREPLFYCTCMCMRCLTQKYGTLGFVGAISDEPIKPQYNETIHSLKEGLA